MSTAALMMVRDESDIIGFVLDHLEGQVDHVYLLENGSTDGTREMVEGRSGVTVISDLEVRYWQARKMTMLADTAFLDGHQWVVPCDADEVWETFDGRPVSVLLAGIAPDTQIVQARVFNYVPTGLDDPDDGCPLTRLRWRLPEAGALPKVACRTSPALMIEAGNHSANYGGRPVGRGGGLQVRHYSWRSEDQYVRKIMNGVEAYRDTGLHKSIGTHWRMWEGHDEESIRQHFRTWFIYTDPVLAGLLNDPFTPRP